MFDLSRIAYFVAVAETGSFVKASEQMKITKSAITTQIQKLEHELAVQLFNRTTRQVQLTKEGNDFLRHCRSILEISETAYGELHGSEDDISGPIRLTATSDTGPIVLAPILADFSRKYPKVEIDLLISDDVLDLVGHRVDLAIREGELMPSSLKSIRLRGFEQWLVCGKQYVAAIKAKNSIEQLRELRWAIVSKVQASQTWSFTTISGDRKRLKVKSIFESNNTMAVLNWIESCPGVAILPDYLVRNYVEVGRLERLLPNLKLPDYKVHALYHGSRLPKRTRLLLDFIKIHLKQ